MINKNEQEGTGRDKSMPHVIWEITRLTLSDLDRNSGIYHMRGHSRAKPWSPIQQSLLIESLLAHIPVPPLVLYESDYGQYDVLDGRQRIKAIRGFVRNNLQLTGLKWYTDLEGYKYKDLPEALKRNLGRRGLSAYIMILPSTAGPEYVKAFQQLVRDHLN